MPWCATLTDAAQSIPGTHLAGGMKPQVGLDVGQQIAGLPAKLHLVGCLLLNDAARSALAAFHIERP